jgi:hypothetical protein
MAQVTFLSAVNAVLPFNPVGHRGTPQLFHSLVAAPHLQDLQACFSVAGSSTTATVVRKLRNRIRQVTNQLSWTAPTGGRIFHSAGRGFCFTGPALSWKQFWSVVDLLMEGCDGLLQRVDYDEENQIFYLVTTDSNQSVGFLARTIRVLSSPPWELEARDFNYLCSHIGLMAGMFDASSAQDRDILDRYSAWYIENHVVTLRDGQEFVVAGEKLKLPRQLRFCELLKELQRVRADVCHPLESERGIEYQSVVVPPASLPVIAEVSEGSESSESEESGFVELPIDSSDDDESLDEWPGVRDDVIASAVLAERLLPFYNPARRSLRAPSKVPEQAKEAIRYYLGGGGDPDLHQIASEVRRRLRSRLPLTKPATLVIECDGTVLSTALTVGATFWELLDRLFQRCGEYRSHVCQGDEMHFVMS